MAWHWEKLVDICNPGPAKTSLLENDQSSLKFPDLGDLYYKQRSLLQTTQANNTHYSPNLGQVSVAIESPNQAVEFIDQWRSWQLFIRWQQ